MLRGKHIMIAVIILLLSLVNLSMYLYWDIPSKEEWRVGSNYTMPMIIILGAEVASVVIYIGFEVCENWTKWWNSEIKFPKKW
tara:strand:- start:284 stop:532 length:249 start_codon:yes stop_codon:yes gene_type:complete